LSQQHQAEFRNKVQTARTSGQETDWEIAAHYLSGLAMFDILPALDSISSADQIRLLEVALRATQLPPNPGRPPLYLPSYRRIEWAKNVVRSRRIPASRDLGLIDGRSANSELLPEDQEADAVRFLLPLLWPSGSRAGQAAFPSADEAAIAALSEFRSISDALHREFSGSVFRRGVVFGFSAPEAGGRTDSNPNVPVPAGTTRVGSYHTHPDGEQNAENFSLEDTVICRGQGVVFYLGTPAGKVKKLTPPALLSPAERARFPLVGRQDILR
jgi:hypothetical protein